MSEFEQASAAASSATGEAESTPSSSAAASSSSGKIAAEEAAAASTMIRAQDALEVLYCPMCGFPPEYCSYGVNFLEKCVPWIMDNCPEALDEETLSKLISDVSVGEDGAAGGETKKKSKRAGVGSKKKAAAVVECKVVIARVQRQKKKFVTAVVGLETVPDLRLKDATKALGKKFASGVSINEAANGSKEVVIQGDVSYDLPPYFATEFNVPMEAMYMLEDGRLNPVA